MSTQHLHLLRTLVRARLSHARRAETGASAVEWVVITALLVGIAVAVGAILLNTITNKADSIDLG
jgi:Flp pilus assembly pilin Flp